MATSIAMPQLGESVTEGTIGRWLKRVGDSVSRDEPLVEVITDKVNVEIPSPEDGVLGRIVVEEGKTVAIGTEICILEAPGTAVATAEPAGQSAETDGATAAATRAGSRPPVAAASDLPVPAPVRAAAAGGAPATTPAGRDDAAPAPSERPEKVAAELSSTANVTTDIPRTSPLVRRLAKEHSVNLAEVSGSGLGGRVTREDIEAFIAKHGATAAAAERPAEAPAAAATGWQPLSPMRRAIADHMLRSVQAAPHVTTCFDIDVTNLMRLREQTAGDFERREGFRPSPVAFVAKALVESLREHPALNASFDQGANGQPGIRQHGEIHLGVAIGLDNGLLVPVIRAADALSIAGLARAIRDLVQRATANKLGPDDMRGGTFTLNNTGAFGSIQSSPILNQGQAGIMTMEAVVRRPIVVNVAGDESIAIRSMMFACLTFDHRVLDGLQAGRFMQSVKMRIEAMGPGTTIY